jgi:hypothetical protein
MDFQLRPVSIRTLGDLGSNFWLAVRCLTCWRWKTLVVEELIEQFGAEQALDNLSDRLRCSQCGSKSTLLYRGYDAGGFKWGEP